MVGEWHKGISLKGGGFVSEWKCNKGKLCNRKSCMSRIAKLAPVVYSRAIKIIPNQGIASNYSGDVKDPCAYIDHLLFSLISI